MSLLSFAKKVSGREEKSKARAKKPAIPHSEAVKPAAPEEAKPETVNDLATRLKLMPLITEESVVMHGNVQTVIFRVHTNAHKRAIAAAVAERFGVKPSSVRTIQMWGKVRRRGRTSGSTAAWKKAYVTLPAGKTIDITA